MNLTPQELRVQFLNCVMEENNITLKSVYEYLDKNLDEIDNMDKVFNNDELSITKQLVLLSLISRNRATQNLGYYLKYYNEKHGTDITFFDSDIDQQDEISIATGLMFNDPFYVSACDWCGLIQREAAKVAGRIIHNPQPIPHEPIYKIISVAFFAEVNNSYVYKNILKESIYQPGGNKKGFFVYGSISLDHNGVGGKLNIYGNHQNQIDLKFIFNEAQQVIPFNIKFCFSTKKDGKNYEAILPNDKDSYEVDDENKVIAICSLRINDVNYLDGIDEDYSLIVIPLGN